MHWLNTIGRLLPFQWQKNREQQAAQSAFWLEWLLVPITFCVSYALSALLELSELSIALAAHLEQDGRGYLNLDELPLAALATTAVMSWLAWRKWRFALVENAGRRAAEKKVMDLLQQNHLLLRHAVKLQEQERRKIAHELHDDLGQYINAIQIYATCISQQANAAIAETEPQAVQSVTRDAAFKEQSPMSPPPALQQLKGVVTMAENISRHTGHIYQSVKQIVNELRPAALDDLGLYAAIQQLLEHWRNTTPQVRYRLQVDGEIDDLGELMSIHLYRIMQESLTNIHKHASANRVEIVLRCHEDLLNVFIQDDGRGADIALLHEGMGIAGMRERAESLGGSFHVMTSPGAGMQIGICLPLTERAAAVPAEQEYALAESTPIAG